MQRNIIKRLTCIVLTVLMVVSMLPTGVFAATSYRYFYVNGKNIITAANNTVQCGNGTATFDAENNILTLENATITATKTSAISSSYYYGIYIRPTAALASGVTIKLIGDNTIVSVDGSSKDYGIYVYSNTDVNIISESGGTLTIDNTYWGIWLAGSGDTYPSSISDCSVTISERYYGIYVNAPFSVSNANVSITTAGTTTARGISGSTNLLVDISNGSVVDISCTGTASCALYATKYASTGTYDPATVTVTDSSLTCTVSDDSTNAAIYASGIE
ncbi:MAG: hypothetical protein LUF29_04130 [Oscillospiraceae bacterium]|nr:hypothetical protein [Oscillospiraceae bacterium]